MKKDEVKIGGVYEVRLHGVLTKVRIEEATEHRNWVGAASSGNRRTMTHWSATNLRTGRRIVIKSAAKLRREVPAENVVLKPYETGMAVTPEKVSKVENGKRVDLTATEA